MISWQARAGAGGDWIEPLVKLVAFDADWVTHDLAVLPLVGVIFIFEVSFDSICIDVTWSSWTSLLCLQITELILPKLGTNERLFYLLTTQSSFSCVELSDIMSQSLLYSSKIVESLNHFGLGLSTFEKPKRVICFDEVLFQWIDVL